MKRYAPLELGLIDEGRFVQQANTDLLDMQRRLLDFVKQHGPDAEKAKAKLTIEVTLVCESPEYEMFSIKAQTKMSLPARPANVTAAIADEDDDGKASLFVRRSGSDDVTPRQTKLCTKAGETIDTETGEVMTTGAGQT